MKKAIVFALLLTALMAVLVAPAFAMDTCDAAVEDCGDTSLTRKVNEYEGQHRKINEYEGQHSAENVEGDPSQWLTGDPSQWESVAGDPSQWGKRGSFDKKGSFDRKGSFDKRRTLPGTI